MKLKSTADGLKAKPVNPHTHIQMTTLGEIEWRNFDLANPALELTTPMPGNTVFEGVEVWQAPDKHTNEYFDLSADTLDFFDGDFQKLLDSGLFDNARLAYQPIEVKEQEMEEAETADEKFWNDLAGDERDDDNRSPHEEYLDAVISLQDKEASNPELGVEESMEEFAQRSFNDSPYGKGFQDGLKQATQQQGLVSLKEIEKALHEYVGNIGIEQAIILHLKTLKQ